MWGAATHDRSTGIHRPLTATSLFVRKLDGDIDRQHVCIGVDHCLLWTAEIDSLLNAITAGTGIERDQITLFFSHTHGAGLMGRERRDLPGGDLILPYLEDLAASLIAIVNQSRQHLEPATIVYGSGRCDLATNRDFFDPAAKRYVCGFNPAGDADDTVIFGRITNDAGRVLGTIVNYACHPTTLAWQNTLISPDYIGSMRQLIETATKAPCLFIQGASGDIGPKEGFVGDIDVAERNGRRLGYAALAVLEGLSPPGKTYVYDGPVVSGATLGIWEFRPESPEITANSCEWNSRRAVVPLNYRPDLPDRTELNQQLAHWQAVKQQAHMNGEEKEEKQAHAMIERATRSLIRVGSLPPGPAYPYPIVAWQMGNAIWMAFDGEHYNTLQRTLRQRFPGITLIIGTIANGSNVWYLPDAGSFGKGLYQEEASILARGCLEQVIDAATMIIEQLHPWQR